MAEQITPQAARALEQLRAIALALRDADEKLSHGMPAFFVKGGKMFVYFWHAHHGDDATAAIVKTSGMDEQAALIEMAPDIYYRPPYFGPTGWVGIHLDRDDVDWDGVGDRVAVSWELVAPRRLLEAGGR